MLDTPAFQQLVNDALARAGGYQKTQKAKDIHGTVVCLKEEQISIDEFVDRMKTHLPEGDLLMRFCHIIEGAPPGKDWPFVEVGRFCPVLLGNILPQLMLVHLARLSAVCRGFRAVISTEYLVQQYDRQLKTHGRFEMKGPRSVQIWNREGEKAILRSPHRDLRCLMLEWNGEVLVTTDAWGTKLCNASGLSHVPLGVSLPSAKIKEFLELVDEGVEYPELRMWFTRVESPAVVNSTSIQIFVRAKCMKYHDDDLHDYFVDYVLTGVYYRVPKCLVHHDQPVKTHGCFEMKGPRSVQIWSPEGERAILQSPSPDLRCLMLELNGEVLMTTDAVYRASGKLSHDSAVSLPSGQVEGFFELVNDGVKYPELKMWFTRVEPPAMVDSTSIKLCFRSKKHCDDFVGFFYRVDA